MILLNWYYPKINMDKPQKRITETASTMVVIKGLATTAGSRWASFAKIGSTAPTSFATITVQKSANATTKDTSQVYPAMPRIIPSRRMSFKKHATAKVNPKRREARNSFQMTLHTS